MVKTLPLLLPLFGILRGRRYTHQWASLLSLAYLAEGLVRLDSDTGRSASLAVAECFLALSWYLGCIGYAYATRRVDGPARPGQT